MTIVKVQLPLVTNIAETPALVYGEGHLFMTQQVLDAETLKAMENDVKAFFEAAFVNGKWKIGKRVAYQDW